MNVGVGGGGIGVGVKVGVAVNVGVAVGVGVGRGAKDPQASAGRLIRRRRSESQRRGVRVFTAAQSFLPSGCPKSFFRSCAVLTALP